MNFLTYLKSGIKMEEMRQNHKSSQEEMIRMDLENDKKNHLGSSLPEEKMQEDFQNGVTKYDEILVLLRQEMEAYRMGKMSKMQFRKRVKSIVENEEKWTDTLPDTIAANARKGS